MGKCQTCEHFKYRAGVSKGLQKIVGIDGPTRPTCYCILAGVAWERKSAEIKKPRGVECNYVAKKFTCTDCGKTKNTAGAFILSSAHSTMICKKCLEKSRKEVEAME